MSMLVALKPKVKEMEEAVMPRERYFCQIYHMYNLNMVKQCMYNTHVRIIIVITDVCTL